ncbi:hypothetical protein LMG18096_00843 [Ralstonia holmesii]|uniref:Uncharacterized protein n=1 Tax=Ralstonia holmesii TaxID=3058602 RepID=A0ABC8Q722_9RALS|nr:hypothetical protein LMG18096_00843 [Ralstonia sp. LMG 32967]CAJ0810319.1 hypothetical protein LMG18093_00952 [Ralstonia sp. LMG 32967]
MLCPVQADVSLGAGDVAARRSASEAEHPTLCCKDVHVDATRATLTTQSALGPVTSTTKLKINPLISLQSVGYEF